MAKKKKQTNKIRWRKGFDPQTLVAQRIELEGRTEEFETDRQELFAKGTLSQYQQTFWKIAKLPKWGFQSCLDERIRIQELKIKLAKDDTHRELEEQLEENRKRTAELVEKRAAVLAQEKEQKEQTKLLNRRKKELDEFAASLERDRSRIVAERKQLEQEKQEIQNEAELKAAVKLLPEQADLKTDVQWCIDNYPAYTDTQGELDHRFLSQNAPSRGAITIARWSGDKGLDKLLSMHKDLLKPTAGGSASETKQDRAIQADLESFEKRIEEMLRDE